MMPVIYYKEKELHIENTPLRHVAETFGTPVYVYSRAKVIERLNFLRCALSGLPARICYPVKCNFNLAILDLLRREGVSFDVASEGELRRVVKIGADTSRVVFTGVGKSESEISYALDVGIGCFHVESHQELKRIETLAKAKGIVAPVALRVNADITTDTHDYIATGSCNTKFGVPLEEAEELYVMGKASSHLSMVGIHCHIGSQIKEIEPYQKVISLVLSFVEKLKEREIFLKFFDIGGGFGVRYHEDDPELKWDKWLKELSSTVTSTGLELVLEPGRIIMAESGVLLTEVQYIKQMPNKLFAVVNAAMNDFIRPALYDGYHQIINFKDRTDVEPRVFDIVGPLCEGSDFMGLNRKLQLLQGDLLAVMAVGAYGSAITSNFSSRPRAPEVLIDGDQIFLIRERESYDRLMSLDHILPE
ncbi:Diaminopimelate decarboxylase, partial [Stegodyphus mimosarum]